MKLIDVLKRMAGNSDDTAARLREISELQHKSYDRLSEIVAGLDNQSRLLNDKLKELIEGTRNQSSLLNDKLSAIIHRQNLQIEGKLLPTRDGAGDCVDLATIQQRPVSHSGGGPAENLQSALACQPLMVDAKTYNTSHPDYNASVVQNFPGKIFNFEKPCHNNVYAKLRGLAKDDEVPDSVWNQILKDVLEEARSLPHADQVFERRGYIENYMQEITDKYHALYAAGWVNLDDALFLYWLVRNLKPRIIVQTGVCNGLSSAFMMLGLVKNGSDGRLHAIDLPAVFDPRDQAWTEKNKVYGFVIPEGKSSGWMVPDAHRDRFELWTGDAKALLPRMVDQVGSIDIFYHDSNHTYDHMMFEFREAKRKLRPSGLIVADDVSWNKSLWDFADQYGVPSYNFKGAVGVAFF